MKECIEPNCPNLTRGLRCRDHAHAYRLVTLALARNDEDAALLRDVSEGLTAARLGVRINRSRQWADRLIAKARRRQRIVAELQAAK